MLSIVPNELDTAPSPTPSVLLVMGMRYACMCMGVHMCLGARVQSVFPVRLTSPEGSTDTIMTKYP